MHSGKNLQADTRIHSGIAGLFDPEEVNPEKEYFLILSTVPEELPEDLILNEEEKQKTTRFVHADDSKNYAYRHHLLNQVIGIYTGCDPRLIDYQHGIFEKPYLKNHPFHFNMSKTNGAVAILFGPEDCGIDIEKIRDTSDFREVANQHFHPDEKQWLEDEYIDEHFLAVWTRKEALLKAAGTGLHDELSSMNCLGQYEIAGDIRYELKTYRWDGCLVSIAGNHFPAAGVKIYRL